MPKTDAGTDAQRQHGLRAYHTGRQAEAAVCAAYLDQGATLLAERWRGQGGEVDLIFQDGADYVFVEVKRAATLEAALARLQPAQMARIADAAAEYLHKTPAGQLSPVRFDLALVNGIGQVSIHQNAFGHF